MLSEDVDKILVEGKDGYDKVKKITKNLAPTFVKKVKQYKSEENTLFASNNIETQINDLFSLNVKLKSGGSIVINTTEALVAVDVNSGKNTSERNIENTALKTNLEAAIEIARQLRLRDLGGLIVIDFIDMDDYRNNFKVEKSLKTALIRDRARVQIGRISMFGLMELSRQRLRSSLIDKSFERCNYCKGSGLILNSSSIIDQILKVIKEKISENKNSIIKVKCNSGLAEYLLNDKKSEINSLENKFESKINFLSSFFIFGSGILHKFNSNVNLEFLAKCVASCTSPSEISIIELAIFLSEIPKSTLGCGIKYFLLDSWNSFKFELKLSNPIFDKPKVPETYKLSPIFAPSLVIDLPLEVSPKIVIVIFMCFNEDVKSPPINLIPNIS